MRDLKTRSALNVPVPPWGLAVTSILSVQLGSALSVDLIETVGPAGTAWLRLSIGSHHPPGDRPPAPVLRPPGRCAAALGLGITTGLVTIGVLAAIEHIPQGTAVAIDFLGALTVQPQQEGAHLAGRGTAGSSRAVIRVPGRPRIDS